MNKLTSSSKHTMLTRVITAIIMCVLAVPCLLFGSWYYFAAMVVMSIVSVFEFIQAPNKGRYGVAIYVVVYALLALMIYSPFFFDETLHSSINNSNLIVITSPNLPLFFVVMYLIVLFVISLFSNKLLVGDVCYLFTMGLYIALTFSCMMYVRYLPNNYVTINEPWEEITTCLLATYVVIGTIGNDIGAYFIGILFGKHKMAPRVSPNKTWEGFAGGIVISFATSFLFAWVMERLGYPILSNILCMEKWWRLVTLSLIMPFVGDIGDLMFSLIKRTYAIKDFGRIFPGHGGILDRVDSLSLVCIVVSFMILVFINGWNGLL